MTTRLSCRSRMSSSSDRANSNLPLGNEEVVNQDVYILIKTGYTSRLVHENDMSNFYGYMAADILDKLSEMELLNKVSDVGGPTWYDELNQRGVDWEQIRDIEKVNDILREHSDLRIEFIDDDSLWGEGVILVYNNSPDVQEIINMGCEYTDGSICFKAPTNLTLDLFELLKGLQYCQIFGLLDIDTFRLSSGAKVIYMVADSMSG